MCIRDRPHAGQLLHRLHVFTDGSGGIQPDDGRVGQPAAWAFVVIGEEPCGTMHFVGALAGLVQWNPDVCHFLGALLIDGQE
eukprot:9693462-Karenia_brevis.AAC.1